MDAYREAAQREQTVAEMRERVAAKREAKKAAEDAEIEAHNKGFYEAYDKAIDEHGSRLVEVDVPYVGKCLYRFPGKVDHAAFTRAIHDKIDLAPCVTYANKCVVYPDERTHHKLLGEKNPEGYVKAALKIKTAMRGEDEEEGKD